MLRLLFTLVLLALHGPSVNASRDYVHVRLLSYRGDPLVFKHTFSGVRRPFTELGWAACRDWDSMHCTPFWSTDPKQMTDSVRRYSTVSPGKEVTLQLHGNQTVQPSFLSFTCRLQLEPVVENVGLYVAYVVNDGERPQQFFTPQVDVVRFALYLETLSRIVEPLESGRLAVEFDTPDLALAPDLVSSLFVAGHGETDFYMNWTLRRSQTHYLEEMALQVEILKPRGVRHRAIIHHPKLQPGVGLWIDFCVYRYNARLTRGYVRYTLSPKARLPAKAEGWLVSLDRFIVQYLNALLITMMAAIWARVLITYLVSRRR
ncbi:membrane protein UL148 [Human betaherpesvirus 5]|uniref:Membrane protein UL148 n=1 Tax=Human cytomegalovirus TaxID=10359 RepID=A0A0G2TXT7_HCMV|nr:membrane protein UL148 [Human betaherpesvirus 5]QZX46644.1 membrane protein UL148 [Human betaherpesvirus 5]